MLLFALCHHKARSRIFWDLRDIGDLPGVDTNGRSFTFLSCKFSSPISISPTEHVEKYLIELIDFIYLTTTIYYSSGQRPLRSVEGWIWFRMIMMAKWCSERMWLKIPDIFLTVKENCGKTSTRKLTRPGIKPRAAALEATTLPPDHSGDLKVLDIRYESYTEVDISIRMQVSLLKELF